jgi:hypothetical protein
MSAVTNPRHPRRGAYQPKPETLARLRVSGNPINGLGEPEERRPSPGSPQTQSLPPLVPSVPFNPDVFKPSGGKPASGVFNLGTSIKLSTSDGHGAVWSGACSSNGAAT